MKPVIGIIGGIGSGKSRVAGFFAQHGGRIVKGDELAHEALRQPDIRKKVVERWGADLLDDGGEVQRRKLAAIVFNDPRELRVLEGLLHPWVKDAIVAEIARLRRDPSVQLIVLDAAVMLEAGWNEPCDHLVFVDAPREVRLQRIAARGWTETDLEQREAAQMPLTEKAARADHVLDNSVSLDELARNVDALVRQWTQLSQTPGGTATVPDPCERVRNESSLM
jgi:dephospho-CoA kinase